MYYTFILYITNIYIMLYIYDTYIYIVYYTYIIPFLDVSTSPTANPSGILWTAKDIEINFPSCIPLYIYIFMC